MLQAGRSNPPACVAPIAPSAVMLKLPVTIMFSLSRARSSSWPPAGDWPRRRSSARRSLSRSGLTIWSISMAAGCACAWRGRDGSAQEQADRSILHEPAPATPQLMRSPGCRAHLRCLERRGSAELAANSPPDSKCRPYFRGVGISAGLLAYLQG